MPPEIANLFDRQRRRLRRVLTWELVARVVAAIGLAYWVGLALDWFFEPAPEVRQGLLLAAGLGVFVWVARTTLEPLFRPVSNRHLASLIEQRQPELNDSLLTTVDLSEGRMLGYDERLAAQTRRRAIGALQRIGDPRVVLSNRAQRWTRFALLGLLSVAAFYAVNGDAAGVYARRLALSAEPWPRRVVLSLEGFKQDEDGVWRRKIARGDAVDIAVRADLTGGHECPDAVWLKYVFEDGPRGRESLAKIGKPTIGAEASQLFRTTLEDIRSDVRLSLLAGDGRVSPIEVQVAARPVISSARVEVTPPGYLSASAWSAPVSAIGDVPEGSALVFDFEASKPLESAEVAWTGGGDAVQLSVSLTPGQSRLRVACPPIVADGVLRVSLTDTDGIRSAEPHPAPISVRPDLPPRVTLKLVGVGAAVTPDAAIGLQATLQDDHGIGAAQIDLSVDDKPGPPLAIPPPAPPSGEVSRTLDLLTERFADGLDAGRLQPGQKITLVAWASDRFDLRDEDRTTSSQRLTLEVITPDQLLARIEQREVNLRRTFEQTASEMHRLERTLNGALAKISPDEDAPAGDEEGGNPAEESGSQSRLRLARLVDDAGKIIQETLSSGESFRGIYEELVGNRIQNSDLLERVDARIAKPLLSLGEKKLPSLRRAIRSARQGNDQATSEALKIASSSADEMDRILDQMRSLETYNEVLAMLRQVIDDQQRVQRATEQARKDQLRRSLFE